MPLVKQKKTKKSNKQLKKHKKKILKKDNFLVKKKSCFRKHSRKIVVSSVIIQKLVSSKNNLDDKTKNNEEVGCINFFDAPSIFNISSSLINTPLTGTPQEVRKELDALALKMQKHPNDNYCFDKIHFYIHKYLLGLVFKKFNFIKGQDENDMYQESLIALFKKAIPNFNPNKGMSFLNFAKMCITRHLITILHASKHRKKDIPMNTSISMDHAPTEQDDHEMPPLSNIIADNNNKTLPYKKMSDKEIYNQTLDLLKNRLSTFEIIVLEEYLNEKSYREVAKNVSKRLSARCDAKSIDNGLLRIRKKAQELIKNNISIPLFNSC